MAFGSLLQATKVEDSLVVLIIPSADREQVPVDQINGWILWCAH